MQTGTSKIKQRQMTFQMHISPVFGEVISSHDVNPDPLKLKAEILEEMPPPKTKRKLQAFFGIINYLSKFSPHTADVFEPIRLLTSSKTEWVWNATYQKLFEKAKSIITEDATNHGDKCIWN